MNTSTHPARYSRYIWEHPGLIVVTGEASEIWKGYDAYCKRYSIPKSDEKSTIMLGRLFASAGLAAVSLPDPEWWGWSITFPDSATGLFCGVEPNGMMCGTILKSDSSRNLVAVQRQAKGSPLTQSRFSLLTHDPVEAIEHYFEESDQTLIRIAVDNNGKGSLLRPLPGGSFEDIDGLGDDEIIARCFQMAENEEIKKLDEMLLFYDCPCNLQQIAIMLESLPEDQQKELWGNLEALEVSCPRCGRNYTVSR